VLYFVQVEGVTTAEVTGVLTLAEKICSTGKAVQRIRRQTDYFSRNVVLTVVGKMAMLRQLPSGPGANRLQVVV